VHPRVAQQGLGEDREARERLYANLPRLVPFQGKRPQQIIALLDWDHRLPSRHLLLRLHAFYDTKSIARFEMYFGMRLEEIRRRNLYPEFDVPDLSDLPSDESYEAELSLELAVESMKLVSAWRRRVKPEVAQAAIEAVRTSTAFAEIQASTPDRAQYLGDLEPVAWMPPCESGHVRWTVDVWWLTSFDGRIGRGWSFLVDPEAAADPVVTHREFSIRQG
jgi:hypothetical protein